MHRALAHLFAELTAGAPTGGGAFILNSGDAGLLRSLDALSAAEASASIDGGATIAAHATHLQYGLSLMNQWAAAGGNPFANAHWDAAWSVRDVSESQWAEIRSALRREVTEWGRWLGEPRDTAQVELNGMIGSVAHLAYHLGAIRQIAVRARGPREGTFS